MKHNEEKTRILLSFPDSIHSQVNKIIAREMLKTGKRKSFTETCLELIEKGINA